MECPFCKIKMVVIDTRYLKESEYTWRRHECVKCGERLTSTETFIDSQVQKAIKRREQGGDNASQC